MADVPLDAEVSWYEGVGRWRLRLLVGLARFGLLVSESVVDFGGD
jgi:hypothetical protein